MKAIVGYPHLTSGPPFRNGQPCIEGTDISVGDIVRLSRQGLTEREMFERYSVFPNEGRIHIALCYYYDGHQAEIETHIAADEAAEAAADPVEGGRSTPRSARTSAIVSRQASSTDQRVIMGG